MISPVKNQINTIFVHVSDLRKSVEWYARLLGQEYNPQEISDPVHNMEINDYTGLTLDAGPEEQEKKITPSPYPLFNFHTDDIHAALAFVKELKIELDENLVEFDDFSFFTVRDPDQHVIMICTG